MWTWGKVLEKNKCGPTFIWYWRTSWGSWSFHLQHSKLGRFRVLNEHAKRKKLYFKNWHNPGYVISTRFDHLHDHDGLKTIIYHLKINSHCLNLKSFTCFIRDLIQFSQMWKTLLTKFLPYFHRPGIMSIFKIQYFLFSMLIFGQKSF